jgi:membrane glycosyltransferase
MISICGSGIISSTFLGWLSSSLSPCIGSVAVSAITKGNTIGSLDRDERGILRFRRGARPGKPLSPTESHGTCI